MKTIFYDEESAPDTKMECSCGEQFWVTPCGEENLVWSDEKQTLIAKCPSCGEEG